MDAPLDEAADARDLVYKHNVCWEVDACEDRCVKDITRALAKLGAHEGSWPRDAGHGRHASPR